MAKQAEMNLKNAGNEPMYKQLQSKSGMVQGKNMAERTSGHAMQTSGKNAMVGKSSQSNLKNKAANAPQVTARQTGAKANSNGNKASSATNSPKNSLKNAAASKPAVAGRSSQTFSGSGKNASAGKSSATNSAKSGGTSVGKIQKKP